MNNIKKVIEKYNLYSHNYTFKNSVRILNTNQGRVVIKEKKKDKQKLYNYLLSRNFNHFLRSEKEGEKYEFFPFIEEVSISDEQKALDLVVVLSILHIKTTFYKENNLDDIKQIFEDTNERIDYLYNYYHELQDAIETKVFMSPSEYLLMRNISKVYQALEFSKYTIRKWYDSIKLKKSSRYVLLHKNVSIDHFLMGKDTEDFISWDKAELGLVIYDFISFYKNDYLKFDMNKLYDVYQSKYHFTKEEELLFFSILAIPDKIDLNHSMMNGCMKIYEWVEYLERTGVFISKQQKAKETTE